MHAHYVGCANNTMQIPDMVRTCTELGVAHMGITDHFDNPEKFPLHRLIKQDIQAITDSPIDVYFGAELNFLSVDGPFAMDAAIKEEYGFQYVIAGIHSTYCETYDLKKIIDIQHRHHLNVCQNPLVDILVHPYWFGKGEFDRKEWPWFTSMKAVPTSYARELGQAAKETGTAIEINACGNVRSRNNSERFIAEYIEFLAEIAATGATFALCSDAHSITSLAAIEGSWQAAQQIGLTPDRIWMPNCKPLVGPTAAA